MTPPTQFPFLSPLPCLLATAPTVTRGNQAGYRAEQNHATFLYNLARLVSWPQGSYEHPQPPLSSCFPESTPVIGLLRLATLARDNGS